MANILLKLSTILHRSVAGIVLYLGSVAIGSAAVHIDAYDPASFAASWILLKSHAEEDDAKILERTRDVAGDNALEWITNVLKKDGIESQLSKATRIGDVVAKAGGTFVIEIDAGDGADLKNLFVAEVENNGVWVTLGMPTERTFLTVDRFFEYARRVGIGSSLQVGSFSRVQDRDQPAIATKQNNEPGPDEAGNKSVQSDIGSVPKAELKQIAAGVWISTKIFAMNIDPNSRAATLAIHVKNDSKAKVTFGQFHGSCSCFKGAEGDLTFAAKTERDIPLRFDFAKYIPGETFETSVAFYVLGDESHPQMVQVVGKINPTDLLYADPGLVDFGTIAPKEPSVTTQFTLYVVHPSKINVNEKMVVMGTGALNYTFQRNGSRLTSSRTVRALGDISIAMNCEALPAGKSEGFFTVGSGGDKTLQIKIPWKIDKRE